MKTLFILPFAEIKKAVVSAVLISLTFWIFPGVQVYAFSEQTAGKNTALVFEIQNSNQNTPSNKNSITLDEIVKSDPLVKNLQSYLENLNSPLSEYADEIVKQPQWQRALAISWVESNMGIHCADNNCSGIGVAPGHKLWRKYPTKLDWFKDMAQLLEKPLYKEKLTTFKQMKGVYVKPGSASWVYGAQDKYDELIELTKKSEEDRQFAISSQQNTLLALATFPDIE
jgi:hypothetical protein